MASRLRPPRRGGWDSASLTMSEEERLRDQREREELERNIRERGTTSTRKSTERKISKREEEEAIWRNKALEQNETEDLRDVIEDEQYLFDGVKLTEAETHE